MDVNDSRPAHWLEIDQRSLLHNLRLFRDLVGESTRLAMVVKANAYGHGAREICAIAEPVVDWFAVHSAPEARGLREAGVRCPILVMGFVPPSEMVGLDADIHLFVSTVEILEWLGEYRGRTGVAIPVHLKVETGTHRQGVPVSAIPEMCRAAARHGLEVVGVAMHFANIEDTLEHDFARAQLEAFERAVDEAERALGARPPFVHTACSAAALLWRETDFTLARVGISAYGHWPSRETKVSWILDHGRGAIDLRPVLSWKSIVGQIQAVPAGDTVGYGRTWTALRPTRLAVIPVGYSDGFPRVLGNRARIGVGGVRVPVVGRVCMNILMADVTDAGAVAVGDECLLLGAAGRASVTAEELAELSGTINYELLARIPAHIPRVVVAR
jgi:alanine racemase